MQKANRPSQTKNSILKAAGNLFAMHGYFHTSTGDILQAVSVSKGAFYHHFKSKEDLAIAVLEQAQADYRKMLIEPAKQTEQKKRWAETLKRITELNRQGQWNNCLLLTRLAQEMANQTGDLAERLSSLIDNLIKFWCEIISDGQEAGTIRKDIEPQPTAELIFATLGGLAGYKELDENLVHPENAITQIKIMLQKKVAER